MQQRFEVLTCVHNRGSPLFFSPSAPPSAAAVTFRKSPMFFQTNGRLPLYSRSSKAVASRLMGSCRAPTPPIGQYIPYPGTWLSHVPGRHVPLQRQRAFAPNPGPRNYWWSFSSHTWSFARRHAYSW